MKMLQRAVCLIKGHDFSYRTYRMIGGVTFQETTCQRCGYSGREELTLWAPDPVASEWQPSSRLPTASGWYQVRFLASTNIVWRYFDANREEWRTRGNDPFDILTASSAPPAGILGTASTHDVFVRRGAQWRGLL